MQTIDLFPSRIFKSKVDPTTYNKNEIVDILIRNYKTDVAKNRNAWDDNSDLHHYYNDWDNEKYEKVPLDELNVIYENKVNELMEQINFCKDINFKWTLENITVNAKHMAAHDHVGFADGYQCLYSGIHYVKFNSDVHSPTTFFNPLMVSQFNCLTENLVKVLDNTTLENSNYFDSWQVSVEEDDFIFFPAYLKHHVVSQLTDDFRITGVVNVRLLTG